MTEKLTKNSFFQLKLTRKEFLKYAGVALISVFGIKNFLSLVHHPELMRPQTADLPHSEQKVFGTRKFGA